MLSESEDMIGFLKKLMQKYQRTRETAWNRKNPEADPDKEEETPPTVEFTEHIPKIKEPGYKEYEVAIFEATLIEIPKDTTVNLYTEDLSTCTAVAMAIREPFTGETFGMLAHFPFYIKGLFEKEFSRYDRVSDDRAEKEAAIIIPYTEEKTAFSEVIKVKSVLQKIGVREENITVLHHAPTVEYVHPSEEHRIPKGRVDLTFEKNGRIFIQHYALRQGTTKTELLANTISP